MLRNAIQKKSPFSVSYFTSPSMEQANEKYILNVCNASCTHPSLPQFASENGTAQVALHHRRHRVSLYNFYI